MSRRCIKFSYVWKKKWNAIRLVFFKKKSHLKTELIGLNIYRNIIKANSYTFNAKSRLNIENN